MRRGELYRVKHPTSLDPRRQRVFVVVSRRALIESSFSTVICAPVYTRRDGLATQVEVGIEHGLKHESSIHCDELISLAKSQLTAYVGALSAGKLLELDQALAIALCWPTRRSTDATDFPTAKRQRRRVLGTPDGARRVVRFAERRGSRRPRRSILRKDTLIASVKVHSRVFSSKSRE